MGAIELYEKEFVERTRHILKRYRGKYKLSNAINCTLGLIILPNEMIRRLHSPMWDTPVDQIDELTYLRIQKFEPIRSKKNGTTSYYPKTLRTLLNKIRNGLAHQNIEPVNSGRSFVGVKIKNYYTDRSNSRELDLVIEMKRVELEKFGLFIAEKYLRDSE
jgi:hypothetical protein